MLRKMDWNSCYPRENIYILFREDAIYVVLRIERIILMGLTVLIQAFDAIPQRTPEHVVDTVMS